MLTPAQVAFYHENGYVAVEDVLSEADIEELRQVTDTFVEMSRGVTENTNVFGLEPGHFPDAPKLRLSVAVVMDDTMLENGCLLVIPGSHKGPIYDHHQERVFVGAVTSEELQSSIYDLQTQLKQSTLEM